MACYTANKEDEIRLQKIKESFGDKYDFNLLRSAPILKAKLKKGKKIANDEDLEIFKLFRFVEPSYDKPRKEGYVYLSIYDSNNTFLYQISFDPHTNTIMKEYIETVN